MVFSILSARRLSFRALAFLRLGLQQHLKPKAFNNTQSEMHTKCFLSNKQLIIHETMIQIFQPIFFSSSFILLCLSTFQPLYLIVCCLPITYPKFFLTKLFLQSIKAYLLDQKYFHTLYVCLPYSFLVTKHMISHCADTYALYKLIALLTQ